MTMNLDLPVLVGEFSHDELEGDVSATRGRYRQWLDLAFNEEWLRNNKSKLVTIVTHV